MKEQMLFPIHILTGLSLAIIVATGVLEFNSPAGVFPSWGYMAGVLLTSTSKRKRDTLVCAFLSFIFILSSLFYTSPEEMNFQSLLLNRFYSFIGLSITVIFVLRSINRDAKVQDDKTKMAGIFLHGTQGILLIDDQDAIVMANPFIEKLFDFDQDELTGSKIDGIIPEITLADYSLNSRKDTIGHRKDRSSFPIEVSLNKFESGGTRFVVVFVTDISVRIKNEEILRAKQLELETVNKELEAFSYSVSHDLRAPLRGVAGYTKMLEEDYGNGLDAEGKRLLATIQKSAENMGALIDDLLAFSRLGKKEIRKFTVNMNELFDKALFEISAAPRHKAQVNIHTLKPVFADQTLMYHVVSNLLSNAIKYSAKVENPVIDISSTEQHDEIIYAVRDNGAGFNMQYVHKLFGVFQRLHSNEEFDGTGVGLAIANRILQKHGGRIWAEGKEGEGASFYFSLPKTHEIMVQD